MTVNIDEQMCLDCSDVGCSTCDAPTRKMKRVTEEDIEAMNEFSSSSQQEDQYDTFFFNEEEKEDKPMENVVNRLWEEARDFFKLSDYSQEKYRQFVMECYNAGYCEEDSIQHYRGRYFYEGPAVITPDVQDVVRATKVKVQWDNMGRDYVVYPK